jgi:hypothetical protein
MKKYIFKQRVFPVLITALVVSSCSESASLEEKKKQSVTPFKSLKLNETEMKGFQFKGDLVLAKSWQDNNGNNYLILSQKDSEKEDPEMGDLLSTRELYIYHYVKMAGKIKQLRKFQDWQKECLFDNRARFIKNAVFITDLDKNNLGEAIFVYRLGCSSELSPDDLKLIITENGKKYAIRGTTKIEGYESSFGEATTNIDSAFSQASGEFLEYAKQVWSNNQAHE